MISEIPRAAIDTLIWLSVSKEARRRIAAVDLQLKGSLIFQERVFRALAFVKATAPVVYRRIEKHVRLVVNVPETASGSQYARLSKTVALDLNALATQYQDDEENIIKILALVLIQDATYACLYEKGIVLTRSNDSFINEVCVRSVQRFSKAAGIEHLQDYLPMFEFIALRERLAGSVAGVRRVAKVKSL